jgi:hypothetical protein
MTEELKPFNVEFFFELAESGFFLLAAFSKEAEIPQAVAQASKIARASIEVKAFGEEPASAMEAPDKNPITSDDPEVSSYGKYSQTSEEAPEKEPQVIAEITLKNGKVEKVPFDADSTDVDSDVEYYLNKEGIDWKSWKWSDMGEVYNRPDEYEFDFVEKERRGDSDEEEFDMFEEGPSDDDIVISEDGRSAFHAGKEIASVSMEEYNAQDSGIDAIAAPIMEWMEKNNFHPNIWQQLERGDSTQLEIKKKGSLDNFEETASKAVLDRSSVGSQDSFVNTLLAGIETFSVNSGEHGEDGSAYGTPRPSNFTGVDEEASNFEEKEASIVVEELLTAKAVSAATFDDFMGFMGDFYGIPKEASKVFAKAWDDCNVKAIVAAIKSNLK